MNNFWQRAITGTMFVGVVVGLTLYHEYSFMALLTLICVGGLTEYYKIVFRGRFHYSQLVFSGIGVALIWLKFWYQDWFIFSIPLVFPLAAIMVLLSVEKNWKHIGYLVGGLFYIAIPLHFFTMGAFDYRLEDYNPLLALNLFVLIWSSDTFAYITGRAFGKNKLFESVSPAKTWEGFFGGAILTVAVSLLLAHQWNIPYALNIAIALCTVVFGTLGDLVESMLKREFGIKDSGNILPGHGGVLDRFDALLISLPFTTFCYYVYWHS